MARPCSVCRHPAAGAIAAALDDGRSAASLAAEYGLSDDAVLRHRRHARRPVSASPAEGDPLDELVTALRVRALAGNPSDTREYRLALAAQADVRHATPPTRDLASEPEWIALRGRMLTALEPFPDARLALAGAMADS